MKNKAKLEVLADRIKNMPNNMQLLARLAAATTQAERDKVLDEVRQYMATVEKPKNKEELVETIRTYAQDVRTHEARLKELEKDLQDAMKNTPTAQRVADLEDKLAAAREELRQEWRRDRAVNDLLEEIGAQREVVRGAKFSLSNHLVAWHAQTGERQVEMDTEGHARDIILTAKLGKDEKHYQVSLLTPGEPKPEQEQLIKSKGENVKV